MNQGTVTKYEESEIIENLEIRNNLLYWKIPRLGRVLSKPAGCIAKDGYRRVGITGRQHLSHRIIWFLRNKYWPENIDHVNGDRLDNRACNMRNVSPQENLRNKCAYKTGSKSGHRNILIRHHKDGTKAYRVQVGIGGGKRLTKTVYNLPDAIMFRNLKLHQLGYHKNHGRAEAI